MGTSTNHFKSHIVYCWVYGVYFVPSWSRYDAGGASFGASGDGRGGLGPSSTHFSSPKKTILVQRFVIVFSSILDLF